MNDIANKLKNKRKEKGLSQIKAAIQLGVSSKQLYLWENSAATPTPENMKKIEKFMME